MYLFHFHFAWYKTLHLQLYSFNTLKMSQCQCNDKRRESILILNVVPRDFKFSSLPLSWSRVIMTGTIFFTLPVLKIQWCCLLIVSIHLENFLLILQASCPLHFFSCLVPWLHTCSAWNYWCSVHLFEIFFPMFHFVEISLIMSSSSLMFSSAILKLCLILSTNCHCHLKKFDWVFSITFLPGLCGDCWT